MDEIIAVDNEAKKKILAGALLLARCVQVTLDESAPNVVIRRGDGTVVVTSDSSLVADAVHSDNPFERIGIEMIRECGDAPGILLACAILEAGMKLVLGGMDPMQIKKGLDSGLVALLKAIDKEPLSQGEPENELPEEIEIEAGFASPYFVTNPELMRCELKNLFIFVTDRKLSSSADIIPILEKAKKQALLIIGEDFDKEALETLTLNHLKTGLKLAAIKARVDLPLETLIPADLALIDSEKTTLQFSSQVKREEKPKMTQSHLLALLPKNEKDPALEILSTAFSAFPDRVLTPSALKTSISTAALLLTLEAMLTTRN
jgi:chaperonin GroEL (HSP60 family)